MIVSRYCSREDARWDTGEVSGQAMIGSFSPEGR
jgi:hypothetical protein